MIFSLLSALFSGFFWLSAQAQQLPVTTNFRLLDDTMPHELLKDSTEVRASTASEQTAPPEETDRPFSLSGDASSGKPASGASFQERWNEVREKTETGEIKTESAGEDVVNVSSSVAAAKEPPSLPPSVEMPGYGTSLSVTGRKVIGFNYVSKRYINDQSTTGRTQDSGNFEMTQQMQIRMLGKIGPKISVNVDYDDTKQNKQDISIVYKGDPQEVVQSASFGDIDMSLPASEFVSYNKQLFGIRVDLKYKKGSATIIGSRTKGITKKRQFEGNTQFQTTDILDTQYIRRQYYDISFSSPTLRLPIKQNSEKVYIDNQTSQIANNIDIFDMTVDDLGSPNAKYTGKFRLLSPGVDYTIDYTNGLITFKSALNSQDVIAIDFTNTNGTNLAYNTATDPVGNSGTGLKKLLKTKNDVYISSSTMNVEVGYKQELKTYYSIGQTQIVRDNGSGNFILKVMDLNKNYVGASLNPAQTYSSTIVVDFEQGRFHLKKPFGDPNYSTSPNPPADPDIYATSPTSKRTIHVEYQYRIKTFTLDSNIVAQSDVVQLDGRTLTRNTDYFIDYESGFITFYNEDRITSTSKIEITYDVSPYGGIGTSSLLGSRVGFDLNRYITVGGTVLYETGTKTQTTPSVSDVAKSLLVTEADITFKNLRLFSLKSQLGLEIAQSKTNPNLNGFALIDNMEGIKQQDNASMEATDWIIASNPSQVPAVPSAVTWQSQDVKVLEISPNAQASSNDTQRVLTINYDFTTSSEVSIVYPYSDSGMDFSAKNMLQMMVYGDASTGLPGPSVNIHMGQINEDSDNSGGTTLHCANGTILYNVPKTEDLNCDGVLSAAEDVGWTYWPSGLPSAVYGAKNGKIDTQDLDHNGRMDYQDYTGGDFGYVAGTKFVDTNDSNNPKNIIDYTGWHTLQSAFTIASTDTYKWSAIKQVRISLTQAAGGKTKGVIKLAKLSMVGNTWTGNTPTAGGNAQISGINNSDNPSYVPIYSAGGEATQVYNDLYGSVEDEQARTNTKNIVEQSLDVVYTSTATSEISVSKRFTKTIDISQHGQFRFLVNNPGSPNNNVFFLRVGPSTDYQEVSFPMDFTGWRLITLAQNDLNGDSIAEAWSNASGYQVTVSSVGAATFQQVSIITAGIRVQDPAAYNGEFYLDEVHLAQPRTIIGHAQKVQGDFELPGWAKFGAKYRYVDRNFQTPVSAVTNQDNDQQTAYMSFTRFSMFPMSANYTKQVTVTPNTSNTGTNNLVSLLQQGVVKRRNTTLRGDFQMQSLPKVGLGYTNEEVAYDLLTRKDIKNAYSAKASYSMPFVTPFLPKNIDLGYGYTNTKLTYSSMQVLTTAGYYNSDEDAKEYSVAMIFQPWKGSSFAPSYSLRKVTENRADFTGVTPSHFGYDKSMTQSAGFTSNFMILPWFNPSVNYNITTLESNNLSVSTVTVGSSSQVFGVGAVKSVNRSASGGVNLTLNGGQIMPNGKLLRSAVVSSSYQLQDGDSWDNVENNLDTRSLLWVRTPLRSSNYYSSRTTLTLRDTVNSTLRWQPMESYAFTGRLEPLRTVSITNSFNKSIQRSEVTSTRTKTISTTLPDAVLSISKLERSFQWERWVSGLTVYLKYSKLENETVNISREKTNSYGTDIRGNILQFFDTSVTGNLKKTVKDDLRLDATSQTVNHRDASAQAAFSLARFRLTPKVDYSFDQTVQGTGAVATETTVITPSLMIRADLNMPKGLVIPFTRHVLELSNRVVWTTNVKYAMKRSPVEEADNSNTFTLSTNADYEISKNLRLAVNAGVERLWHLYLPTEDYMSYQAGTTMTLQF